MKMVLQRAVLTALELMEGSSHSLSSLLVVSVPPVLGTYYLFCLPPQTTQFWWSCCLPGHDRQSASMEKSELDIREEHHLYCFLTTTLGNVNTELLF